MPLRSSQQTMKSSQAGMTIVELMVAVAIGLIAVVIMFQAVAVSEGYRRNTVGGGDAQSNASIGLFNIQQDVRNAGYGMTFTDIYGRNIVNQCSANQTVAYKYDTATSTSRFLSFTAATIPFAPVVINPPAIPAGDGSTDIIQVIYSGAALSQASTAFPGQYVDANTFSVSSARVGFNLGDLVLVAGVPTGSSTPICSLVEVTGLPTTSTYCGEAAGNTYAIAHKTADSSYVYYPTSACSGGVSPTWNPPSNNWASGGVSINSGNLVYGMPKNSLVLFNMGSKSLAGTRFGIKFFAVRNHKLTRCDLFSADCTSAALTSDPTVWVPIADNVVSLQAQYGLDDGVGGGTADDGKVDTWTQTMPTSSDGWNRTLAIRFSIVSRSANFNKELVTGNVAGNCPACMAAPTWSGAPAHSLTYLSATSGSDEWQHFYYRSLETVVPLRNMIWK